MQDWNLLHAARWKYLTQKIAPKSSSWHHHTTLSGCTFATKAYIDNRKKLLNSNTSSVCPHNMVNFGPLTAGIGLGVWGTPGNFNGFRVLASLLRRRRSMEANPTCTVFGRLLAWYAIYTFSGSRAPWRNFATCKIHFVSISAPSHKFLGL